MSQLKNYRVIYVLLTGFILGNCSGQQDQGLVRKSAHVRNGSAAAQGSSASSYANADISVSGTETVEQQAINESVAPDGQSTKVTTVDPQDGISDTGDSAGSTSQKHDLDGSMNGGDGEGRDAANEGDETSVATQPDVAVAVDPDPVVGSFVLGQKNATTIGQSTRGLGLQSPYDVFSDGKRLFVADSHNNRILIWNAIPTASATPADIVVGSLDMLSEGRGVSAQLLHSPLGIFVADNKLFVADSGNNRVLIWNTIPTKNGAPADVVLGQPNFTEKSRNVFSSNATGTLMSAKTLNNPQGVYVAEGKLFVADTSNRRILIWNKIPTKNTTAADVVIGHPDAQTFVNSDVEGQRKMIPNKIMVKKGRLFVPEWTSDRILIWNTIPTQNNAKPDVILGDGTQTCSEAYKANQTYNADQNVFCNPTGIAGDDQHFFVSDRGNHRILIWNTYPNKNGDNASVVLGQETMTGRSANRKSASASSMFFGNSVFSDGQRLFHAGGYLNRVLIWNSIPTQNNTPADVVLGQKTFDYVERDSAIDVSATTFARDARGIASNGKKLVVADHKNHRVLIWNSLPEKNEQAAEVVVGQSSLQANEGSNYHPATQDNLYQPNDVAIDEKRLFVTDFGRNRVLIWNSIPTQDGVAADVVVGQDSFSGKVHNMNRRSGSLQGNELSYPGGVFSTGSKLIIGDSGNRRILIWNKIPTKNGTKADVVLGAENFTIKGAFHAPKDIKLERTVHLSVFASETHLVVADASSDRVLIWNKIPTTNNVKPDVVLGQADLGAYVSGGDTVSAQTMNNPTAAYIYDNKLYVVDSLNHRIMVWNQIPTQNNQKASRIIGQKSNTDHQSNAYGLGAKSFFEPQSLVATKTHLMVVDPGNYRVLAIPH